MLTDRQKNRLHNSLEWSRRQLSSFRKTRMFAIKQYVGRHYSNNGAARNVPINLLEQTVSIFVRQLVARNPKARVHVESNELKPFAVSFKLALDHLIREIELEDDLWSAVVDALFLVGIVRSGLSFSQTLEIRGTLHDVGQPFADVVSFDNFLVDMTASRWEDAQYIGDRFKIPLDMAKQLFPEHAELLKATGNQRINNDGYDEGRDIMTDTRHNEDVEYEPRIELTNIYLPATNTLLVMSEHIRQLPILREVFWTGVEKGPYHRLEFSKVPQGLLPLSPIANLIDMHEAVNEMIRKMVRQAERQKTITTVQSGDAEDGERVTRSNDGTAVALENPAAAQELSFGGIDQKNFAFAIFLMDRFSRQAGNLDALGGLSPQSETLGQDAILNKNASSKIDAMEYNVNRFVKEILKSLGFFLFHDPLIDLPLTKRSGGIEIPSRFSQFQMEGDFYDYNVDIEPLSMRPKSSQQQLAALLQIVQTVVFPGLPFLQQEGKTFDFSGLLEDISELGDIPQLRELIIDSTGEFLGGGVHQVGERPTQASVTRRENVRINRPGSTQQGKDEALIQTLLGGAQQQSAQAITRPTG